MPMVVDHKGQSNLVQVAGYLCHIYPTGAHSSYHALHALSARSVYHTVLPQIKKVAKAQHQSDCHGFVWQDISLIAWLAAESSF